MRLTTARYYTPSGRSIQALGVSPDIVVEQPAPKPAVAEARGRASAANRDRVRSGPARHPVEQLDDRGRKEGCCEEEQAKRRGSRQAARRGLPAGLCHRHPDGPVGDQAGGPSGESANRARGAGATGPRHSTMTPRARATCPTAPASAWCWSTRRGWSSPASASTAPAPAWQMPQGGIDTGETPRQAALRELWRGNRHHRPIWSSSSPRRIDWITYDLPPELLGKVWGGKLPRPAPALVPLPLSRPRRRDRHRHRASGVFRLALDRRRGDAGGDRAVQARGLRGGDPRLSRLSRLRAGSGGGRRGAAPDPEVFSAR